MWIIVLIIILVVVIAKKQSPRPEPDETETEEKSYSYSKKCLMTNTEKQFFTAIKNSVGSSYTVQPQINLASIIQKEGEFRYQNELYRNIDFGVFDETYNIVLLIEINDESHEEPNRRKRDANVKNITSIAGIPLVTFYTKYGVNQEYIAKRINEHL